MEGQADAFFLLMGGPVTWFQIEFSTVASFWCQSHYVDSCSHTHRFNFVLFFTTGKSRKVFSSLFFFSHMIGIRKINSPHKYQISCFLKLSPCPLTTCHTRIHVASYVSNEFSEALPVKTIWPGVSVFIVYLLYYLRRCH